MLLSVTLLWDRWDVWSRAMKIKTFRPEISIVDIMIAKVSFCLLPVGAMVLMVMIWWSAECQELQSCRAPALSFYHICIQPTSVIPDSNKFAHSPPVPCWWQWNRWTQQSSSPHTAVQSGSNSVCAGLLDCHIVTPSSLACNSQSEYNTIVSAISYEQWEPSPSPSSTESNDLAAPRTQFGWETHNLGNKIRKRDLAGF